MNQIQVELQDIMGSDKSIAEAAWTSSTTLQGKSKRTQEDIERVVKLLAESKHSVPFESVVFRFWIKMPISIDRQFMTHRIASNSGMSGRYRTMPSEFLNVPSDVEYILTKAHRSFYVSEYVNICKQANDTYKQALNDLKFKEKENIITNSEYKRAREFLRGMLPQNNMTERVSIMNLRSFANFVKLRNSEHAQPEIRQVAQLMLESVKQSNVCPMAVKVLEEQNWII